jgi:hypothetical protein
VIPVEVTQTPWATFWAWVDHWQTLIAGFLAFVAGVGTVVAARWAIWVTRSTAKKQIDASREEADKVIAATREQTETTVRLERERVLSEADAFRAMLEAAMARVLAEAAWAGETYLPIMMQQTGSSVDALTVRTCITKGAFAELRAACVRQGGPLTGDFLDLEREIDSFALQCEDRPTTMLSVTIRMGKHAGLDEQLARIETKAGELLQKAVLRDKAAGRI